MNLYQQSGIKDSDWLTIYSAWQGLIALDTLGIIVFELMLPEVYACSKRLVCHDLVLSKIDLFDVVQNVC